MTRNSKKPGKTPQGRESPLHRTATGFVKKLADTLQQQDPRAEAEYQRAEAERDRKVTEQLARHMRTAKK